METLGILLWWVVVTVAMAIAQGFCMAAIKRTPSPSKEATRQAFALHWLLGGLWFAAGLAVVPFKADWHWWLMIATMAGSVRFAFFDPVLNRAEGTTLFAVGESAITDRVLQGIAKISGIPVTYLSAVFRLLAFLLLVALIVYKSVYYVDK